MLETTRPDQSFRVLLRECGRRRDDALSELRECIAGLLAISVAVAPPLYWMVPGSQLSLVEASEAEEPNSVPNTLERPLLDPDAVLDRLETDQLTRFAIRAAQARLKQKGFDPGPIDGIAGKRTLAALNAYRQSIRLSPALAVNGETIGVLYSR